MYGGMCTYLYTKGILDTLDILTINNTKMYYDFVVNESLITRGRNKLVFNFLNSDSDYLIFIDADIKFSGSDVLKLISADKDILCGLYPTKVIDWESINTAAKDGCSNLENYASSYVINTIDGNNKKLQQQDVIEIRHGGTGFMCIHRSVFEKLSPLVEEYRESTLKNKNNEYDSPVIKNFFSLSIDKGGLYLSEDYHFCELWKSINGKIFADLSIKLGHVGTHVFQGNLNIGGLNIKGLT
jgi:hypothetical protein